MGKKILLFCIIAIALLLRVYHISSNPPSLSWDEVSIGYNAYSILETGKDEHGRYLPIDTFIAYGDYKPPIPIYVTVPSIAAFGLNEFAVRLPVALFGTLTVFMTYFLILELFRGEKGRQAYAFLGAAGLALSPWHVNLSRAGFEATIGLFWIVLGTYLFLRSREASRLLFVAFVPFILAIYTFNSTRYFGPLFVPVILWFIYPTVRKEIRKVIVGGGLAFIILLPIIPHLLSPQARLRFEEVNIFSDPAVVIESNTRIAQAGNAWWAKLLNNRRVGYSLSFAKHYLDHFQPDFLFVHGDGNPKFSIQDVGQLYLIEAPFLAIGFIVLIKRYRRISGFLLAWLLLAIIPAAVARETPHALRTLNTLPTWQIAIAVGIIFVLQRIRKARIPLLLVIIAAYLFNVTYYLHTYYVHYPVEYSGEWQYGYREAIAYAEQVRDKYKAIVVTDYIGRPYMYTLFYTHYNPKTYLQTRKSSFDASGFYTVSSFGQYEFVRQNPTGFQTNVLYILPPGSAPRGVTPLKIIYRLNGTPALEIFTV